LTAESLSSEAEQEFCAAYAPDIYEALQDILKMMSVNAHVSYRVVEEVVIHFWRDVERLYAIHHDQVHVTKSCSYVAFWVRKLKPISDAYPSEIFERIGDEAKPALDDEITAINEEVAILLAIRLLRHCIEDNRVIEILGKSRVQILKTFDEVAEDYLVSEIEDGMKMGLRFQSMVYDMRYRTFGPHHLTQFLTHIMREVYKECNGQPKL
jgi:hypothetical protein